MSKVSLTFDLPEEREEFNDAINGIKYLGIIENMDEFLRRKLKYEDHELTDEQYHVYEQVRKELMRLRNEN